MDTRNRDLPSRFARSLCSFSQLARYCIIAFSYELCLTLIGMWEQKLPNADEALEEFGGEVLLVWVRTPTGAHP